MGMAISDKVLTIKIRPKDFVDKKECVFSRFLSKVNFCFRKTYILGPNRDKVKTR